MCLLAEEQLDDMIGAQNDEMRPLSFQIKKLRHPQDKQVYVGFVNTVSGIHAHLVTAVGRGFSNCRQAQGSWDARCGFCVTWRLLTTQSKRQLLSPAMNMAVYEGHALLMPVHLLEG
jgi:hypothetical protein